ncbi:phage antirepressor KilAC domain-containing protein [Paraburkholderia sp. JHI869]|uniref:phage antirepressor KilAC domain-containing protein n=1 Tax=Paraburkholderia sp. JHI869 TaxID=3112959 RepID=UPI00316D717F
MATMTQFDFAALTGKRSDHVVRVIRGATSKGAVHPRIEDEPRTDSMGRTRTVRAYHLTERDSYVVMAQLSPEFTGRLVDRWRELEAAVSTSPWAVEEAVLRLTAPLAESVAELTRLVNEQAPKAVAFDRLQASEGAMCIRDSAKAIHMQPSALADWLIRNAWCWRSHRGRMVAYQTALDAGALEHKSHLLNGPEGDRLVSSIYVTPRGLARIAQCIEADKLAARGGAQ